MLCVDLPHALSRLLTRLCGRPPGHALALGRGFANPLRCMPIEPSNLRRADSLIVICCSCAAARVAGLDCAASEQMYTERAYLLEYLEKHEAETAAGMERRVLDLHQARSPPISSKPRPTCPRRTPRHASRGPLPVHAPPHPALARFHPLPPPPPAAPCRLRCSSPSRRSSARNSKLSTRGSTAS